MDHNGWFILQARSSSALSYFVFPNKTVTWWTTVVFVGFALLSLAMVAAYFLGHHQVSEEGLSYGRLTGRRGYLR